jgi:hypothetical protein
MMYESARGLSPGPAPSARVGGPNPRAGLTPNVKPTGVVLDTGCSALGAGPGATRASSKARARE